ncbi:MAG: hypothetical protein QMD09_12625, partial [Desulfatibacillaceae bacterium]|nr:hypothetical protein [Desulfatibacillaceae bacterium]
LYEADGTTLAGLDRHYFEKTFGPLEDFDTRLVVSRRPFPFRAWLFAAVGLPIGALLLFAFVWAGLARLVYGRGFAGEEAAFDDTEGSGLARLATGLARADVFVVGGLVFVALFGLWAIPDLLAYMGRSGLSFVAQYRWIFLGLFAVGLLFVAWLVYLRYLLAKKGLEHQAQVQKYRLELEYRGTQTVTPAQISYLGESLSPDSTGAPHDPAPKEKNPGHC